MPSQISTLRKKKKENKKKKKKCLGIDEGGKDGYMELSGRVNRKDFLCRLVEEIFAIEDQMERRKECGERQLEFRVI